MGTRLRMWWERVRSSYWFLPTLMALGAMTLSYVCLWLDWVLWDEMLRGLGWTYTGGPEGARAVLSAIASSMMTVAGVTFSITIVALSLASQQFGPRLLRNFMRDTGNQVVLGTFLSTYLYCLLVLRAVRGTEELSHVPHLSITVAVFLAVVSVAVLIYFIHHVAESIQVGHLLEIVTEDLTQSIDRLFPQMVGEPVSQHGGGRLPVDEAASSVSIQAQQDGYLQAVDEDALLANAKEHNLIVVLHCRPGEFLVTGSVLAEVRSPQAMNDALVKTIDRTFVIGRERTTSQDAAFAFQQLVEVALRALSPGTNDPFTALACIDRIAGAFCRLTKRALPETERTDENGVVRVVVPQRSYADYVEVAIRPVRLASRNNPIVAEHLEKQINLILSHSANQDLRSALLRQSDNMIDGRVALLNGSSLEQP